MQTSVLHWYFTVNTFFLSFFILAFKLRRKFENQLFAKKDCGKSINTLSLKNTKKKVRKYRIFRLCNLAFEPQKNHVYSTTVLFSIFNFFTPRTFYQLFVPCTVLVLWLYGLLLLQMRFGSGGAWKHRGCNLDNCTNPVIMQTLNVKQLKSKKFTDSPCSTYHNQP